MAESITEGLAALLLRPIAPLDRHRAWGAKGIDAGDIRGLDGLPRLPSYDKADIMESVANFPPLGDFHGQDVFDWYGVDPLRAPGAVAIQGCDRPQEQRRQALGDRLSHRRASGAPPR